jgi:membrane fusion protein (multidrug efflux system)
MTDRISEKTFDKTSNKITDKIIDKTADKTANKAIDKTTDKAIDKITDKTTTTLDKATNKAPEKIVDKAGSKAGDKTSSKANVPSSVPHKKTRMLRKKRVLIPSTVLLIALCSFGLYCYLYALSYVTTDDAFVEGHAVAISPKVSGHISKVHITDNQEVKEGALLAEIDARDYESRLKMAKANLEAAEAKAIQANEDVARYKKLIVDDEISKQEMDHVIVKARVASAEYDQAKAAFEQAELELSYTRIYAPATGRITEKAVEEGMFVQVGQTLLTIVTPERWVVANLKETELKNVLPGQPVIIRIDAYPGKTIKGHVDSIQRGTGARFSLLPPENASGNYVKVVQRVPVKIVFDEEWNHKYALALGMSVIPAIRVK